MKTKQEILTSISEGLKAGIINESDLETFITSKPPALIPKANTPDSPKHDKLSAVDVMFYIAGIVLFAAILSSIVRSWEDGSAIIHILMSGGIGLLLWSVAYYLVKNPLQNDIRKGLTNALLVTGSLLITTGGYITTNELVSGFDEVNFIPSAIMLAIVGGIHIGFDRLIKRDIALLMGIVLAVASFPSLIFGFLQGTDVPMDVWSFILIVSALILAYSTRVVGKMNPDRPRISTSFDSLAAFLTLMSMYVSSYGEYGVLWLGALIAGVFGLFYISIITQRKRLLGQASAFLILTVITISFKYFSGAGPTISLFVAAIGLLGSGAVAASINKKYFKQSAEQTEQSPRLEAQ